jgi:DNA repair protein RadC
MATVESTSKPRTPRRRAVMASDCIPAYGAGAGVLSFRHGLPAKDCRTIDKALAILGRLMQTPQREFNTPDAVKVYLQLQLAGETVEHFVVLFLDVQNRFLAVETMAVGTVAQTSVYPREIVRAALAHGASAVVLAHNHPSGKVQPSRADMALTDTLKHTLALIDVRVLDHVIVAPDGVLSMAETGQL